jgi:PmbA protein
MDPKLAALAQRTIDYALKRGAREAAVSVSRARFIDLKRREGKTETLQASTSRGLSLALYVDGRFSSNATSLLEQPALEDFVDQTLAMTRHLAADPHRYLPDPELYGPAEGVELDLVDPGYDDLTMDGRQERVAAAEEAARQGREGIISVTTEMVTQASEALQIHSNGFRGDHHATSYMLGATVTVRDEDDRRPEDHHWTVARHLGDLPAAEGVGREAAERALGRRGSRKVESGVMPMVVENRAAGRLVSALLEPLSGAALQQHRSCFDGKLGEALGSELLTLTDEPLRPRGLGSRLFDGEGLAARRMPVFEGGRLQSYFIDVYYGRKLGRDPTTGGASNLVLPPGEQDREALLAQVGRGILVTGFLGGNSNAATGDFSFGVRGYRVEGGKLSHAVGEMNITGSLGTLWHGLVAVGDDPYPFSAIRMPTLVFEDVQFSGV